MLYREGDEVEIEFLMYPGPVPFKTVGKVIKCLSPTYYTMEYVNYYGKLQRQNMTRSQLH